MEWQPGARDVKAEETFIPWHRVIYFKVNDRIVWDKSVDFDEVFFSGDANALKQMYELGRLLQKSSFFSPFCFCQSILFYLQRSDNKNHERLESQCDRTLFE